jgi:hypothetical protein
MAAPAAASCVPIDLLLPEADDPGAIVFVGTVLGIVDPTQTALQVEAWYLGDGPADQVIVTGGRDPLVIASTDWAPDAGEQFIVVATRSDIGSLDSGTCQQGILTADTLATLQARYGNPQLPPFAAAPGASPAASQAPTPSMITSGESPLPGSLVHGRPTP